MSGYKDHGVSYSYSLRDTLIEALAAACVGGAARTQECAEKIVQALDEYLSDGIPTTTLMTRQPSEEIVQLRKSLAEARAEIERLQEKLKNG